MTLSRKTSMTAPQPEVAPVAVPEPLAEPVSEVLSEAVSEVVSEDVSDMDPVIGRVKWFDATRGFGFVVSDALDGDILVHFSVLREHGRRSLPE